MRLKKRLKSLIYEMYSTRRVTFGADKVFVLRYWNLSKIMKAPGED